MKLRRTLSLVLMMAAVSGSASIARASESIMGGGYTIADFPMGDWGEIAGFGPESTAARSCTSAPTSRSPRARNLGLLYNFSRTQDIPQANLGPNSALSLETKNASLFLRPRARVRQDRACRDAVHLRHRGLPDVLDVEHVVGHRGRRALRVEER